MKEIEALLESTPYKNLTIGDDDRTLLFLKDEPNGKKQLYYLNTDESLDLENATLFLDEDFSKRTYFNLFHSIIHNTLYIQSDNEFNEVLNIYKITKNKMVKLTDAPYVGAFGFNNSECFLAFASRHGRDDTGYLSDLVLKNLTSGDEEVLFQDQDFDYRLGWGEILFSDDNQRLIIPCDYKSQRRRTNFILFDRETKKLEFLLPKDEQVADVIPLRGSFSNDGFAYISDKEGSDAIYWYDLKSKSIIHLFQSNGDTHSFFMSKETNTLAITIAKRRENQSHLVLLKIKEGSVRILFEESFPGTVYPYSFNGLLWLYHTSMNQPAKLTAHSIDSKILKVHEVCFYKREVEELIDFDYEYLEYESFDGKKVPALLSLPPGKIRAAYIISFYGGTNSFYKAEAIFAKYGIACLSPAVRGSWEYGKEWRDFIKGDLGGNEIVDLIWGAKFLEKRLNLKPSQIGVMGGSHGGYATLRALTFPESFNGVNTRYDWGFGICSAGFADLIDFYKTSNIPDWLDDMLGSYKDNEDKYIERSPLHNFERLRTPLMIEHGTNDTRVPYSTMTHFVDKLEKSNIPHEIIIKEGSGHNYSSAKEEAEVYEKEISFILRHIK